MVERLSRSTLFAYTTLFRSDHLLAPRFGHLGADDAREDVREAAGREGDDDADGFGRVLLRQDCRCGAERRQKKQPSSVSGLDRKSTRLNSSHGYSSYAVFCL